MDQLQQWLWLQLCTRIWCVASNWWGCEQVTEVSQMLSPALQLSHSEQQQGQCLPAEQYRLWWCHSSLLLGECSSQSLPSVLLSPSLQPIQVGQMELQVEWKGTVMIKWLGTLISHLIIGSTSQNTEKTGSDVSATYGCLHWCKRLNQLFRCSG